MVDDDEDIRETIETLLTLEGYRVTTAADGQDALTQLQSEAPLPELILLDLMMPVMSGWQFRALQMQHVRLRDIPTVMVSGDTTVKEAALAMGGSAWLKKPISVRQLLATARRFCQRPALDSP